MDSEAFPRDLAETVRKGTAVRRGVADVVYEALLETLHAGRLEPGQRINDLQLAEELGVSRTPVREALQRLREIGVIESAPNRFTRIASVSLDQARKAVDVWAGLYLVLLDEVGPQVTATIVKKMTKSADRFRTAIRTGDSRGAARANLEFYEQIVPLTTNPFLLRSIESVVHIVWLATLTLSDWVDLDKLADAHTELLDALRAKDPAAAKAAIDSAVRCVKKDSPVSSR